MFCPSCGLEERNPNQFCRACGANLSFVRAALEKPDPITLSAISARDEIGRAIAAKIRETRSIEDLAEATEELLPQIKKFLESPEERRLRRIRSGTILSSIGLGAAIGFSVISVFLDNGLFFFAGLGWVCFFIGLGLIINGFLFTVPRKSLTDKSSEAKSQRKLDTQANDLVLPGAKSLFSSVIEETTRHLEEKQPMKRP